VRKFVTTSENAAGQRHRIWTGKLLIFVQLIFVVAAGFIFGTIMLVSWIPRFAVASYPVVTGKVIARAPITEWGVPRTDFTIEIPASSQVVHAFTQRYLLDQIPADVRFHYSGDPSQQVYLFEHEENPLWIGLFCWAASAILVALVIYYRRIVSSEESKGRQTI
jgi:hypothetical protein